ncbi:hypothetical protein BD410DRAFT_161694 [Rickenella mellea]|uniref:Uncharacterized protein n=1 Tax=Rickenella mellea TaxID=50990 RepID=A0A4Y7Q7R4_9AGAM|nr:hypothetical protein BD410DRAFT_161694 [Rickenella mellea]
MLPVTPVPCVMRGVFTHRRRLGCPQRSRSVSTFSSSSGGVNEMRCVRVLWRFNNFYRTRYLTSKITISINSNLLPRSYVRLRWHILYCLRFLQNQFRLQPDSRRTKPPPTCLLMGARKIERLVCECVVISSSQNRPGKS